MDNIESYDETVKSLVEAKVALMTEPIQMDDIYDRTIYFRFCEKGK